MIGETLPLYADKSVEIMWELVHTENENEWKIARWFLIENWANSS